MSSGEHESTPWTSPHQIELLLHRCQLGVQALYQATRAGLCPPPRFSAGGQGHAPGHASRLPPPYALPPSSGEEEHVACASMATAVRYG